MIKTHQMPLRIPASLHKALKSNAKIEGVSLNQYCLYVLAKDSGWVKQMMSRKGEELLRFINEAMVLQEEMTGRPLQPKKEPAHETLLERYKKIHDKN